MHEQDPYSLRGLDHFLSKHIIYKDFHGNVMVLDIRSAVVVLVNFIKRQNSVPPITLQLPANDGVFAKRRIIDDEKVLTNLLKALT